MSRGISALGRGLDSSSRGTHSRPNHGRWRLVLDEQWQSFNPDLWGIGQITAWEDTENDDAEPSEDHVIVEDEQCILRIESKGTGPGGCYQGMLNTSIDGRSHQPNKGFPIEPNPGHYFEARIKMPGRTGILPAFWAHPANDAWPPEIDVVELFQYGDHIEEERRTAHMTPHWTTTATCDDWDAHTYDIHSEDTGIDLTETFNTYGCAWFEDRIEWYFNGEHVITREGPREMIDSMTNEICRTFGLIFSNHVNRVGKADLNSTWIEEMIIDWIRVWEFAGA